VSSPVTARSGTQRARAYLGEHLIRTIWPIQGCPSTATLVTTREAEESWRKGRGAPPSDEAIEATLSADGDQAILVIEVRGMPWTRSPSTGPGGRIHAENLAAYLAGRERGDTEARWDDLLPPYQELAASIG